MELVKSNYFILANLDKYLSNEQSNQIRLLLM